MLRRLISSRAFVSTWNTWKIRMTLNVCPLSDDQLFPALFEQVHCRSSCSESQHHPLHWPWRRTWPAFAPVQVQRERVSGDKESASRLPVPEARNVGERHSTEHFCVQVPQSIHSRAGDQVRPPNQQCNQRLGHLLLGHEPETNSGRVWQRYHGHAEETRQERTEGGAIDAT